MKTTHILAPIVALTVSMPALAQSDEELEARIRAVEKKIQHAADIEAVKNLMTSMQFGMSMGSNVQKTLGQCFGQNDGYIYGNFGKRVQKKRAELIAEAEARGEAAPTFGGGPGAPPGGAPGGPGGAPGGPGGAPGGPGGAPGGPGGAPGGPGVPDHPAGAR